MLKNLANSLVGLSGAFEIVFGPNLLLYFFALSHERLSQQQMISSGVTRNYSSLLPCRSRELGILKWLTCSGVTGFWDVLCNSSMVF
jgi:hypothetical protein